MAERTPRERATPGHATPGHASPGDPATEEQAPADRGTEVGGLRALAHPLRLRLLSLLTGSAMSAAEAARELGESQANTSYHLRRLHAADLLEVAEEVSVRGGRARRYRYRYEPDSAAATVPDSAEDHRLFHAALAREADRRSGRRDPSAPRHFTDAEVWVPADRWAELVDRAEQLGGDLHDAALPPRSPGAVPVSATMLLFGMRTDERPAQRSDPPESRGRLR